MAKRPAEKENITFRLDNDVLARISQEAEQKGVSMNSVAQNVFSDYFGWSAYAPRAGMIPLHKTVLGMMVDRLSEKDIIEIADLFAKVKVKNMILVLRNDYNANAFLDVFEAWLKSSSHSFTKHINHKTVLGMMVDRLSEKDMIEIADLFAKVKVKNMILVLRNDYNVEVFLDVFEAWLKASSLPFTKHTNHETEVYTITHELGSKWSTYLSHMLQTIFGEMGFKEVIIEKTDDIVMFKIPLSQVVENLSLSKTSRASSKQSLDR